MAMATLKKKIPIILPRARIKKIEAEMWNLKVKAPSVVAYNRPISTTTLMCAKCFPKESDQIERYIGGLPDMILGSVKASKSKTMQEVIEFTTELMEDKTKAYVERLADNKRKAEDSARNNQIHNKQEANTGRLCRRGRKRRGGRGGNVDRGQYEGPRPWCSKCNYHHYGPCASKCHKCNRFGHLSRDCKTPKNANPGANQGGNGCFECGAQGHPEGLSEIEEQPTIGVIVMEMPRLRQSDAVGNTGQTRQQCLRLSNRYTPTALDHGLRCRTSPTGELLG
ncbi:putative reverse transcriptase domain-containing protein [Tanacetum coccineum]